MDASDSKTGKALLAGTAALAVCAIRKNIRQEESNTEQPGHLSGLLLSLSKKSLFLLGESGDFFDKLRNRLCLVDKGGFFSGAGEET